MCRRKLFYNLTSQVIPNIPLSAFQSPKKPRGISALFIWCKKRLVIFGGSFHTNLISRLDLGDKIFCYQFSVAQQTAIPSQYTYQRSLCLKGYPVLKRIFCAKYVARDK